MTHFIDNKYHHPREVKSVIDMDYTAHALLFQANNARMIVLPVSGILSFTLYPSCLLRRTQNLSTTDYIFTMLTENVIALRMEKSDQGHNATN